MEKVIYPRPAKGNTSHTESDRQSKQSQANVVSLVSTALMRRSLGTLGFDKLPGLELHDGLTDQRLRGIEGSNAPTGFDVTQRFGITLESDGAQVSGITQKPDLPHVSGITQESAVAHASRLAHESDVTLVSCTTHVSGVALDTGTCQRSVISNDIGVIQRCGLPHESETEQQSGKSDDSSTIRHPRPQKNSEITKNFLDQTGLDIEQHCNMLRCPDPPHMPFTPICFELEPCFDRSHDPDIAHPHNVCIHGQSESPVIWGDALTIIHDPFAWITKHITPRPSLDLHFSNICHTQFFDSSARVSHSSSQNTAASTRTSSPVPETNMLEGSGALDALDAKSRQTGYTSEPECMCELPFSGMDSMSVAASGTRNTPVPTVATSTATAEPKPTIATAVETLTSPTQSGYLNDVLPSRNCSDTTHSMHSPGNQTPSSQPARVDASVSYDRTKPATQSNSNISNSSVMSVLPASPELLEPDGFRLLDRKVCRAYSNYTKAYTSWLQRRVSGERLDMLLATLRVDIEYYVALYTAAIDQNQTCGGDISPRSLSSWQNNELAALEAHMGALRSSHIDPSQAKALTMRLQSYGDKVRSYMLVPRLPASCPGNNIYCLMKLLRDGCRRPTKISYLKKKIATLLNLADAPAAQMPISQNAKNIAID